MFGWDDLELFLALYRERTTVRAAACLGISQPTVVRRLSHFEKSLGLCLFDRGPAGLLPTEAADTLYAHAEGVERAVARFAAETDHLAQRGLSKVRLTFLDHFERLVVPILRDYRAAWPGVKVELLADDRIFDLGKGEADIAIRGRAKPESDAVLVRPLPMSGWTVYAARGMPGLRCLDDIARHPILLPEGQAGQLPIYRWLEGLAGGEVARCTGYGALRSAVASGAGLSALPVTIGDHDGDLERCFPVMREFDVPIYLAAPRAALRRPPVRDLFERIHRFFFDHPEALEGVD